MLRSIREYVSSFGYWGWVVVVGYFSGGIGAYLDVTSANFPTWAWIILFVVSSLIVPFIPYHKMRTNRDELRGKLDQIEQSRPNIKFINAVEKETRVPHTYTNNNPFIISLIFVNNPEYPTESMVARNVRADLTFFTSSTRPVELFSLHGCWDVENDHHNEVDISPNGKPMKLDIVSKYRTEQYCYGFGYKVSAETEYPYGVDIAKRLDIGNYLIEIILQGNNIKEIFHFLLENQEKEKSVRITVIEGLVNGP